MPNNIDTKIGVIHTSFRGFTIWLVSSLISYFFSIIIVLFPLFIIIQVSGFDWLTLQMSKLFDLITFSFSLYVFVKSGSVIKREMLTYWNIFTPPFHGVKTDKSVKYNKSSIFTSGRGGRLLRQRKLIQVVGHYHFAYSIILYLFLQSLVMYTRVGDIINELSISLPEVATIIYGIIGLPIVLANLIGTGEISIVPSTETFRFVIEIGIPSILMLVAYSNYVKYLEIIIGRIFDSIINDLNKMLSYSVQANSPVELLKKIADTIIELMFPILIWVIGYWLLQQFMEFIDTLREMI